TRSEMRPQIGANTNCMSEKIDMMPPRTMPRYGRFSGPGSKGVSMSRAYSGSSGNTMPKPSRSMNTTRKTMNRADREDEVPGAAAAGSGGTAGVGISAMRGLFDS